MLKLHSILILLALSCSLAVVGCGESKEKKAQTSSSSKKSAEAKKMIKVTYINYSDQSVISSSELSPKLLPDYFSVDTTMELQGQKWSVVKAEPSEKAAFVKTGILRLELSKITMFSAEQLKNLLYPIPTISNDLASNGGDIFPNDRLFAIHEDDWRQIEFISNKFSKQIDQELIDIQRIYTEERKGYAFKSMHVRERIPNPLKNKIIHIEDLKKLLPPKKTYDALSYFGAKGSVMQSFAWSTKYGTAIWGQIDKKGNAVFLCVSGIPNESILEVYCKVLVKLMTNYGITYVDWCNVSKNIGNVDQLMKYFKKKEVPTRTK